MAKLIKLRNFIKTQFEEGEAPDRRTLISLIENGQLPGKRIGRDYYIDLQRFELTGNSLVDNVLLAS